MQRRVAVASLFVTLAVMLSACGASDNDPGPGGVTVGEARALDEAAQMIEQRRPPLEQEEAVEAEEAK